MLSSLTQALRGTLLAVLTIALLVVSAGCGTGKDAVAQGDTFEFVSPGGKTEIFYNPPSARKKVANLSGPNLLTGNPVSLNDFSGEVVVVNVWASWCGPCRTEASELEQAYTDTAGKGVTFLGLNFRDDRTQAQDFVRDRGLTYPSIYDNGGKTLVKLTTPTSVVPTTVVLDRDHRAAAVYLRAVNAADLLPEITRLAAEPRVSQ